MDIIIILIILIVPMMAQILVTMNYNKYRNINNKIDLCGQEVAKKILDENNLENVYVVATNGTLTDHYDSSRKVIRLSKDIFDNNSVASISVAAHECGHAIQDKDGYIFMKLRSLLYPIVRIGTMLSYIIIFIGMLAQALDIVYVGIALVFLGLLFQLVTLPVEFDASKKALEELKRLNLVTIEEEKDVFDMLRAAAFTYVAGVLTSILELVRLITVFDNKKS